MNPPRTFGLFGVLAATLLAASCTAGESESPSDFEPLIPTPPTSGEPSPTSGSSLTITELAGMFVECADAYNAESARLYREEQQASTLKQLISIYEHRSANTDAFIGCLGAIDWPDSLDPDVREVIDTLTGLQAVEDQMASATTLDELRGYRQAWNEAAAAVSVAANALRADLDLPPS